MQRVESNGGTAGLITAALLVVLFLLFFTSGLDPQTAADPAKAIPLVSQKSGVFAVIGVLSVLAAAFTFVFAVGIYARLREKAPTRAAASLGFALLGLTGYALTGLVTWQGGKQLVELFSKDQVAASHAWVALNAATTGFSALGMAFVGASVLVAGWAIVGTAALSTALGWLAVIAGVVSIIGLFSTSSALFLVGEVLFIAWLAWGGSQLRRAM